MQVKAQYAKVLIHMKDTEELFSRGVASFIDPNNAFKAKLEAKIQGKYDKDIVIKFGIDPTRPDIHLGHAVILRKLRIFQELGCKIIFLVGDFTALIGDPTGKSKVRPELELKEISENIQTYKQQVNKILLTTEDKFSWIVNSDWFYSLEDIIAPPQVLNVKEKKEDVGKNITFPENSFFSKAILYQNTRIQNTILKNKGITNISLRGFFWTLRHITHARLIERDMFQDRFKRQEELYLHEMMYPVLQGIDSYAIAKIYGSCDLEIGGTDQTFNMLMGRDVLKINNEPEQAVMALDILEGLDGKDKMSKSLDNYLGIAEDPANMYGKILSIPDDLIPRYFLLATPLPKEDIEEIKKQLSSKNINPRDIKMRLARLVVEIYHGKIPAENAEKNFVETFSEKKIPENVPEISGEFATIIDAMMSAAVAESKTEARRLVEAGAVTHLESDVKIMEPTAVPEKGTYRVGKIRFFRIV